MRLDDQRESDNLEDRRGSGSGGGGSMNDETIGPASGPLAARPS